MKNKHQFLLLILFLLCQLSFIAPVQIFSQAILKEKDKHFIISKKKQVLEYIYAISGKQILSGQHNERSDSTHPFERSEAVFNTTGKYPALFGIDFSYDYRIKGRWQMIFEAEKQFKQGAMINIMWHSCIPTLPEPCIRKEGIEVKMPDSLWSELTKDNSSLNKEWKRRLDTISIYLAYLQNKGVVVLWRPLHEMNQGVFWWGGRPGPEGTAKLYQLTHDYLTKTKGLQNLIWVWDIQDFPGLSSDAITYNPGDNYWDILALDFYSKTMYTAEKYAIISKVAGSKPMVIGECGKIPSPEILQTQPRWAFFMAWAELIFKQNDLQLIKDVYNDTKVITLDKMTGWDKNDHPKKIH